MEMRAVDPLAPCLPRPTSLRRCAAATSAARLSASTKGRRSSGSSCDGASAAAAAARCASSEAGMAAACMARRAAAVTVARAGWRASTGRRRVGRPAAEAIDMGLPDSGNSARSGRVPSSLADERRASFFNMGERTPALQS